MTFFIPPLTFVSQRVVYAGPGDFWGLRVDTSQDGSVSLTFEKLFFHLLKTLQMAAVVRARASVLTPFHQGFGTSELFHYWSFGVRTRSGQRGRKNIRLLLIERTFCYWNPITGAFQLSWLDLGSVSSAA